MKNALIYFYDIYIDNLNKINNDYYFLYNENNYLITIFSRNLDEAVYIYSLNKDMLNDGTNTYEIIPCKDNSITFYFESNYYILMRMPNFKNRLVTIDDILLFRYVPNDEKVLLGLNKSSWNIYWENRIDYHEKQFSEIEKKYPVIRDSINFYIGLWENAISYYNDNINFIIPKEVVHKRVGSNTDLLSFYNPLNLIIDYKERDISEYLKSYVLNESFTKNKIISLLDRFSLDKERALILITRTMFPSIYFDIYEDVILDNRDQDDLLVIINKRKNYITLLNILFKYYSKYNIPFVEWILKEDN